jgi:hypothetical protein
MESRSVQTLQRKSVVTKIWQREFRATEGARQFDGCLEPVLQGAWPFGLVEAIWAGVALRRWYVRRR